MSGLPILSYHAIDDSGSVLSTPRTRFRETLAALLSEGFTCVDLDRWIADGRPAVTRGFALTFDDGLRSIRDAAEVIARFGCTATAFLVAGRFGKDNAWPGQPRGIPRMELLAIHELESLRASGFRFGAHTLSHPYLSRCDPATIDREITESRTRIEDAFQAPCRLFAYPYGDLNRVARECVARQFTAAFGTRLDLASSHEDVYQISRVDAYYLNQRGALSALIEQTLPRRLRFRRLARSAKHFFPSKPDSGVRSGSASQSPTPQTVCPTCKSSWVGSTSCEACERAFPPIAGIPDLRIAPDRYLTLDSERAKAARLAEVARRTDLSGLANAYYAMTDDVDKNRSDRFLRHIERAETRGHVLAALIPDDGPILEVGCGTGGLLVAARRRGLAIQGTDIASRWLVLAQKRLDNAGEVATLTAANAEALPWPDATFACVVADSVIEHLDDPGAAMAEWLRVTRPGGRLVLWSPNRFSLMPDPHVGIWGLGWLPRRLQSSYVRFRRGIAWSIRPLSATSGRKIATSAGWSTTLARAAQLPITGHESRWVVAAAHAHARLRHAPLASRLLRAISPIWELHAVRPEVA